MYSHIFNVVTDVIAECQDIKLKSKLIKAQQYAEGIFTGENIRSEKMMVDEETIVMLLNLLKEQEREKAISEQDISLIEECEDWISDLEEGRTKQFLLDFEKEMRKQNLCEED